MPTADVFGVRVFDVIPGESYKNPRTGVELIPGRDRDDDAPSAPLDAVVSIVMNKYDLRSDVESLAVHGTFSPDTVFVRVDIKDADGFVSLLLPHNALSSCDPGFTLTGRQLTVELRSIDLAGNESPPYVAKVELVTTFNSGDFDCRGR